MLCIVFGYVFGALGGLLLRVRKSGGDMMRSYTIGSFNMYKMDFKSNEETRKKFDQIAEIIRAEQFDVIGLQEVMSEMAVKRLVRKAAFS